jgi:hypothetical protein
MDKVSENMYCLDWFLAFRQTNLEQEDEDREPEINPYPSVFPPNRKRKNTKY